MKTLKKLVLVVLAAVILSACTDIISEKVPANLQFHLTDSPGEYQEVNIDVIGVKVILNDSLLDLETNEGVYNLLEFVNGKDTLLVDEEIETGYISQVRLVLGENNTVMVDSMVYDLKTPSAQQSGLKFQVHEEFIGGESYAFVIDFVVDKSVHKTGNGKYMLKPVIRVFSEAVNGSVKGVVQPADARPYVTAMSDTDTASTYADTVSGSFMIRGLPEGVYAIEFEPVDGYMDTVLNDVSVVPGQASIIDTLFIVSA